jgi:plastocyanin
MKLVRSLLLALSLVSALVLTACGGGSAPAGGGEGGKLAIEADGENLAYKPAALTAKAGAPVVITFKNTSTAQQHNLVVANGGDDVATKVDEAAIAAGGPDYLPTGADVLAGSKMLQPGGSADISFTAPAAGSYVFLCTYPGHAAAGMKGTLTVAP